MKKILFSAYSLDVGGIETALVTLLNELAKKEYDITLVLEKKQGIFLDELSEKINIIEYTPCANKNILIRKIKNMIKRIKFTLKYKNKFDFAASYATYSLAGSFIARTASKNNALWVHSEYMKYFGDDKDKYIDFFNNLKVRNFKNVVFVSKYARNIFINQFKDLMNKCVVINNVVDYKKITELAEQQITDYKKDKPTILYVGRLTEEDKRFSRIIEVSEKLKTENIEFNVLVVGDGKDKDYYLKKIEKNNLKDEFIFLGSKKNPYPYFKLADCLILTSEYEGFPVVYNEARILNVPIVTTDVSDSKEIVGNKYGIVTKKNVDDILESTKKILTSGFVLSEKFDAEKYNEMNLNIVQNIIEEK